MTRVSPSNGNETKSDVSSWDILNSDVILIGRKILKHFNDFYNWHLSISLQKETLTSKVK